MQNILPRKMAITIMGDTTRKMYRSAGQQYIQDKYHYGYNNRNQESEGLLHG